MEIHIKIDAVIHIHNPGDLQPEIDRLNKLAGEELAKTKTLNDAVKAAGEQPK